MVNVVHQLTRKHGGIDWLNDDINAGKLDYYYFLIAGLASINLMSKKKLWRNLSLEGYWKND